MQSNDVDIGWSGGGAADGVEAGSLHARFHEVGTGAAGIGDWDVVAAADASP